jgi:hypothetical protein
MPIPPRYTIPANQFANSEESIAGTSDNKAVTPRGLNAALRYLGIIPGVAPSFDSVYVRIDTTKGPYYEADFAIPGVCLFQTPPNQEYGSVTCTKKDVTSFSHGQIGVHIKVLIGNTLGYLPVYFGLVP